MSDKFKEFVNSMGVLCETWTLVYKSFLSQGMDAKDAMIHTQGFMTSLMAANALNNGGNE